MPRLWLAGTDGGSVAGAETSGALDEALVRVGCFGRCGLRCFAWRFMVPKATRWAFSQASSPPHFAPRGKFDAYSGDGYAWDGSAHCSKTASSAFMYPTVYARPRWHQGVSPTMCGT
jgi:hypothetical protein